MRKRSNSKIVKYLPVFIILISLTIILGSTFAYFTDRVEKDSSLTFSKVELSDETNVGISGVIKDAIPGSKLIDGAIEFSKSIDSEPIFVRAKISFSTESENPDMATYVEALRNSNDFGIISQEQNGAYWSQKEGNYFYLLNLDKTALKVVDDTYNYKLIEEMIVPYDLEQLPNLSQYMESVNFNVSFQAIQAENITGDLKDIKELFNITFPESEKEKFDIENVVTFYDETTNGIISEVKISEDGIVEKIEYAPSDSSFVFMGWYKDKAYTQAFEFDTIVNDSISLYPKVEKMSDPALFEFDGDSIMGYYGEESDIILPTSYSISGTRVVKKYFADYYELYNYFYEVESYPVTVIDANDEEHVYSERPSLSTIRTLTYSVYVNETFNNYAYGNDYSVTKIGQGAFRNNSALTSVVIPGNIGTVGSDSFFGCKNLEDVTILKGVHTIGNSAFYDCINLSNVSVPSTARSITRSTFFNTEFYNNEQNWVNGLLFLEYNDSSKKMLHRGNHSAEFVTAEQLENVDFIAPYAFYDGLGLKYIEFSEDIKDIANNAFMWCVNLREVIIPSTINSIATTAFEYCYKLVHVTNLSSCSVTIPENPGLEIKTDLNTAFNNKLITNNGYDYFIYGEERYLFGCDLSKTEIKAEEIEGITSIYQYAIYPSAGSHNKTILSITLPEGLKRIEKNALHALVKVKEFIIPSTVEYIGEGSCSLMSIMTLTIPSSVKEMGSWAFGSCYKLVQVTDLSQCGISTHSENDGLEIRTSLGQSFTNTLTNTNGIWTFTVSGVKYLIGCDRGIETITASQLSGITKIYQNAFYYEDSLKSIELPSTITAIGSMGFSYNVSIETIYLNNSSMVSGLSSEYSSSSIASNAKTIFINKDLTSIGSYVTDNFTKDENLYNSNGVIDSNGTYYKYSKNS